MKEASQVWLKNTLTGDPFLGKIRLKWLRLKFCHLFLLKKTEQEDTNQKMKFGDISFLPPWVVLSGNKWFMLSLWLYFHYMLFSQKFDFDSLLGIIVFNVFPDFWFWWMYTCQYGSCKRVFGCLIILSKI